LTPRTAACGDISVWADFSGGGSDAWTLVAELSGLAETDEVQPDGILYRGGLPARSGAGFDPATGATSAVIQTGRQRELQRSQTT